MAATADGDVLKQLRRRFMPNRRHAPPPAPNGVRRLVVSGLNAILGVAGLAVEEQRELAINSVAQRYGFYWYNAPKKVDIRDIEGFRQSADRVLNDGRTYLNYDRLYTLWQGVMNIPLADTAIAEVGAFKGGSARLIAEALRLRGMENPFYVCDTFEGHTVVDETVDGGHKVGKQFRSTSAEQVRKYLSDFPGVRVIVGDFMETSAELPEPGRFGFVHVDVDVYPVTRHCLEYFGPRVVEGGFIVVDDYGFVTCVGARKAVEEFVAGHTEFRRIHLLTGQALLVKCA
jgi:O-methyltransferase